MKRFYLLGFLLTCASFSPYASSQEMPSLKVHTLSGKVFDLATLRGKWVIVNYWATWCHPCIHEMPAISTFAKQHADVAAIGLAYQDIDPGELKIFLKKYPVSYPVAQIDPAQPLANFDMPQVLPTTYLIGPDGRLAKKFVGPLRLTDLSTVIGQAK